MTKKVRQPPPSMVAEKHLGNAIARTQRELAAKVRAALKALPEGTPTAQAAAIVQRTLQIEAATGGESILAVIQREGKRVLREHETLIGGSLELSATAIMAEAQATMQATNFAAQTVERVGALKSRMISELTASTIKAVKEGQTIGELLAATRELAEKQGRNAKMLARNQIQNFNANVGAARAEGAGVKKAIWRTSQDERVRESHADREGKEFELSQGLYSDIDGLYLIPGEDYNCRCVAEYIVE